MESSHARRVDFDEFVVARSGALLRTAYLLTRDHQLAEDLLQASLTKAWFAWGRTHGNPEAYVRKIIVNTYSSWWRRKWNGEDATEDLPDRVVLDRTDTVDAGHDLWEATDRLPRRQRAGHSRCTSTNAPTERPASRGAPPRTRSVVGLRGARRRGRCDGSARWPESVRRAGGPAGRPRR